MILTMYIADQDDEAADERVMGIAIEESVIAGGLGFNPWFTEHHFRGPWHSNPMQFGAYVAPQIPKDRFLGFGVLSTPSLPSGPAGRADELARSTHARPYALRTRQRFRR